MKLNTLQKMGLHTFFYDEVNTSGKPPATTQAEQTKEPTKDYETIYNEGKQEGLGFSKRIAAKTIEQINELIESGDEIEPAKFDELLKKGFGNHASPVKDFFSKLIESKKNGGKTKADSKEEADANAKFLKTIESLNLENANLKKMNKEIAMQKDNEIRAFRTQTACLSAAEQIRDLSGKKIVVKEYMAAREFDIDDKTGELIPKVNGSYPFNKEEGRRMTLAEDIKAFAEADDDLKNLFTVNSAVSKSPNAAGFINAQGNTTTSGTADANAFLNMSLDAQIKFMKEHPAAYKQILKQQMEQNQ